MQPLLVEQWDLCSSKRRSRFSWRGFGCATFLLMGWEERDMPDFEKLYYGMVRASEAALRALEQGAVLQAQSLLIAAQRRAEQEYLDAYE